jgi:translation initiation factor IF-2
VAPRISLVYVQIAGLGIFLWLKYVYKRVAGPIESLRHIKSDVDTIKTDVECGLVLTDSRDSTVLPEPGDRVVCYELKEVKQSLDWTLPA